MKKNSLLILGFLLLSACSQNEPNPTVQSNNIKSDVQVDVKKEVKENLNEEVKKSVKEEVKKSVVVQTLPMEAENEFIPEHIKRSHIEVVEHH